jgi:prefoldin subunit 5
MTPNGLSNIFEVAVAVIASLGGATVLLFALSSWLGKVWAARIMEHEKAELTRSIEREKAELFKFHEAHRSQLQELATERQDALNRRRDIYSELATRMRVLLKSHVGSSSPEDEKREDEKRAFLAAYDRGYIWASETVIVAVRDLLETLEKKSAVDSKITTLRKSSPAGSDELQPLSAESSTLDREARNLYQRCMLEMRKDAGFPISAAEYRVVSF